MEKYRGILLPALIGLAYFAAVAFSCRFGRPDGGVAMAWVAGAMLAACLLVLPRAAWPRVLAASGLANVVAGGWFGLGWAAAPWLTLANLAEAIAAEKGSGPRVNAAVDRCHEAMGRLQKETLAHVFAMRELLRPDQAQKFDQAVVKALTEDSRAP